MTEEWLIDGCNLLHGLKGGRAKRRPLVSRESLCDRLAGFAAAKGCRLTLVFDGIGNDEEFGGFRSETFSAFYAQASSADARIERYLFEHRARASAIVVVTDDRAIRRLAAGGGVRVLGLAAFLEELEACGKEQSQALFRQKARSHGFNRPFENKL